MRTNNFRRYLSALYSAKYLYYSDAWVDVPYLVDTSGKKFTGDIYTGAYPRTNSELIVGSGNTPPTEDDYKLENKLDIEETNQTAIFKDKGLILIGNFHNRTSEAVTISEVALQFNNISSKTGSNSGVILSRDLITPITIPSGETRTIQYTIEF